MARILIVGCGCRGRRLGRALSDGGHAVRGTSRSEEGRAAVASEGFEGVLADPGRLGTLLPHLQGVSALCWLMGTADDPALNGERFATLLETLVDTHVRGVVHEAAAGAEAARYARETYRMPVALVTESPGDLRRWLPAAVQAADEVPSA